MGIYMLSYEHACCVLKRLPNTELSPKAKKEPMPRYVQIIAGGIAGTTQTI